MTLTACVWSIMSRLTLLSKNTGPVKDMSLTLYVSLSIGCHLLNVQLVISVKLNCCTAPNQTEHNKKQ